VLSQAYANTGARMLIEATVTGPSRQQISGRQVVKIHRGEFEIGLKLERYLYESGKAVPCSLAVITPEGAPLAGQEIVCRVLQVQWNSVRQAGIGGRYHWISQREVVQVDSLRFTSTGAPQVFEFTPKKAGYFVFEAEGIDRRGHRIRASRDFYASGSGYVAWARRDDDLIQLLPDASQYAPGDTARILVQSPFDSAQALITIERESVLESFVQNIRGSAVTLKMPIRDNFLPNVFVSVVLLYGRSAFNLSETGADIGKPQFKIGYAMLAVSPESRRLRVQVQTDRQEYRPGDRVRLRLSAQPAGGKAMPVEFTIAAVDAGVLNLIGYRLRDPFETFYGTRKLSVRTAETLVHLIEQRSYGEKGEAPGGGGASNALAGIDLRSHFVPLAYWNPALRSDDRGRAEAEFVLPDNLTTFRIMVIAHSQSSEFGGDQAEITVNKPLLLQASGPRFVRVGDRFMAGVVATNNTSFPGKIQLQASARGVTLQGKARADAKLQPGESREFLLPFRAESAGQATFSFRAELRLPKQRETDGLSWSIPVQFPYAPATVATFGNTGTRASERLQIPANTFVDSGFVEIAAASTAMLGLRESVRYLFEYPYDCLEQRLSRVLPVLLAQNLIEAFDLDLGELGASRAAVQQSLEEIAAYQRADGGFSLWKGGRDSYPYVSAYALWALAEARRQGYSVPQRLFDDAVDYAKRLLRRKFSRRNWAWGGPAVYGATRALAYYALGRAGQRDVHYGEVLFKARDGLPLFARAMLLRGLAEHGAPERLRQTVAAELMNAARVEARTAHFQEWNESELWWCWSSSTRTTAAVLQALLEAKADFPLADRVVRWLMQQRRFGRWRSTQENLYAFDALATYLQRYESVTPAFRAEIRLAGKAFLQAMFSGRSDQPQRARVALAQLPTGQALPVEISKDGPGRLYYGLHLRYFPKNPAPASDQGMSISRQMEIYEGEKFGDGRIAAGSLVRVTLTLSTPQERHFVVIDDPLPAGFEAVNLRFETESRVQAQALRRQQTYRFNHVEMHDDRVLAFADFLPAGVHTYTYLARATGIGSFVAPAPRCEEMYAPEVFGRGEAGVVEIR